MQRRRQVADWPARGLLLATPALRRTAHATDVAEIRTLKRQGWVPRRIVTDKLAAYGAAKREVAPSIEHRRHGGLNNRAENTHLPLRKREPQMQHFRSAGGLQRFTSVFSAVRNLFVPPASKRPAFSPRPNICVIRGHLAHARANLAVMSRSNRP